MSSKAIRVKGLGKEYQIGEREAGYTTFREAVVNTFAAPFRRLRRLSGTATEAERFWALKDVSFDVEPGEVVGIIGRNGAGKSTLLKVLSQITEPTTGEVELNGRVASLLEVGTGFHPELTGRENIYLNGSILGMSRAEIKRKFDEIVAFAEVDKFLDTPVKRYSSGMYVRLAFAVAAHLEPEILIVDEVLAVGDVEFQKKCLGKMGEVARGGRTVLFVSHNMGAISALCDSAIWLEGGYVHRVGEASRIVPRYLSKESASGPKATISESQHIRGGREVTLLSASLADEDRWPKNSFTIGESAVLTLDFAVRSQAIGTFFLVISTFDGTHLVSSFQRDNYPSVRFEADGVATVSLSGLHLLPGNYRLSAGIFDQHRNFLDWAENIMSFEVLPQFSDGRSYDHRVGFITQRMDWHVESGRGVKSTV